MNPAGSPTARPEASIRVAPGKWMSLSMLGVLARLGALPGPAGASP